jgi:dienelactone hydrolase
MMPYFHVLAEETLIDEVIEVQLHELEPNTLVTIRAQFTDDLTQTWVSEAQFRSDANGKIELSTAIPMLGSYEQPDPMGLFWSMQVPTEGAENVIHRPATNSLTPLAVNLTAAVASEIVASTTLIRRFLRANISVLDVREDGLVATLFVPTDSSPKHVVVVFGGSGGGFTWSKQVASVLASYGCAAMAVAYFDWAGEYGLPDQFVELPVDNFAKIYRFLANHADLNLDNLTVIGFSKGAELVLLLATLYPEIKRVIAYVPSSLVWQGFLRLAFLAQSSWSFQGQSLPFAAFANGHFDDNGWQDQAQVAAATILVEKITAPLLLISAGQDRVWPSTRMANDIMDRMSAAGCPLARKHLALEQGGHSLSVPNLPTVTYGGVNRADNAQAERLAWAEVLEFLDLPVSFV